MLIIESQSDAIHGGWTDPLIDVNVQHFTSALDRMSKLEPGANPEQLDEAYDLAKRLCDASRQIVYRLHRVTREQLRLLCDAFNEGCRCIREWKIVKGADEKRDLILDFATHIAERSARLSRRID